jgi:hypothetical protein
MAGCGKRHVKQCTVSCRYGVKYPALYAPGSDANANAFNCVQRGHQNSLEQLPHFLSVFAPSAIKVRAGTFCYRMTPEHRSRSAGARLASSIYLCQHNGPPPFGFFKGLARERLAYQHQANRQ